MPLLSSPTPTGVPHCAKVWKLVIVSFWPSISSSPQPRGPPLFTEELASALRDAGLISIIGGECYLSPETGDLKSAQFPDSLEAVITGRIDRLAPQLQLVLKVTSVLGRVFPLTLLRAIHPIEADRANLAEHLAALERRGLLALRGGSVADPSYGFKHALTQDVAYNLLPFSQRQQQWLRQNKRIKQQKMP